MSTKRMIFGAFILNESFNDSFDESFDIKMLSAYNKTSSQNSKEVVMA
jgi:hypothetical protein